MFEVPYGIISILTTMLWSRIKKQGHRKVGTLVPDHRAMHHWSQGLVPCSRIPLPMPEPLLEPQTWVKSGRTFYSSLQILGMLMILQKDHSFHGYTFVHAANLPGGPHLHLVDSTHLSFHAL